MAKKIMVIEDEENVRLVVSLSLEKEGYEVESVATGEEALEKVVDFAPDLIVLDIMMPGMDGWEVLGLLKSNELTEKIPVCILTAKGEVRDMMYATQKGAADYITKPFTRKELVDRVGLLLATGAEETSSV
ncbi:MAG: response regulator [Candidatus Coatesbacteria bacterium]|nr:MAG: response regulator [Candidatus Coatesbacteria bacterium]